MVTINYFRNLRMGIAMGLKKVLIRSKLTVQRRDMEWGRAADDRPQGRTALRGPSSSEPGSEQGDQPSTTR